MTAPFGVTELGAELWPCKECGKTAVLAFLLCCDCRKIVPNPLMSEDDIVKFVQKERENEANYSRQQNP